VNERGMGGLSNIVLSSINYHEKGFKELNRAYDFTIQDLEHCEIETSILMSGL